MEKRYDPAAALESIRSSRKKRAEMIRLLRSGQREGVKLECFSTKLSRSNHLRRCREHIVALLHTNELPRITPRAFRSLAIDCLAFSRTAWHNPHSSENYSACGYDDYQGDLRDGYRRHAVELVGAANLLEVQ